MINFTLGRSKSPLIISVTAAFILITACSDGAIDTNDVLEDPRLILEILEQVNPEPGMLPHIDPWTLSGDIIIAGSSTVFPLAERVAERFQDEGFPGNITVDSIGSGAGFERFCVSGESDIVNASRPIKDSERKSCQNIGRNPIEFRVGTDALALVVSAENEFLQDISLEQLAFAFSTAQVWSDLNPDWPQEPILRFSPGTDSGTFDYFVEAVFDKNKVPILSADNIQFSEDDNVLVRGVLGSPNAIGYFGYAYYLENADSLILVSINGIKPTAENVNTNLYPLSRPLYIYSDAAVMSAKPQVSAYINFFLTYANEEVAIVGYFPLSTDDLRASKMIWLDSVKWGGSDAAK